eukprot:TRINITY_DN3782_c0_g1_i2.p1 TRINITY_DN3782_c0_g1~~TRINITY_DN3782_c0_g1_i2.p1  ORF type:complete len:632 (+),score=230.23 TRINITY_DN3782_c0_g1_i2:247-2142(+)
MWPVTLDLDRETCLGILRRLELEAYSSVAKALRAQGDLNKDRRKILSDLGNALSIPLERHKAEMRRVANDELLSTIAWRLGDAESSSWAHEGRRIIPLLRRARPVTSRSSKADEAKESAKAESSSLLPPEKTRTRASLPPLKKGRHPAPPSLADSLNNGGGAHSLPQRPNLPEDIVLLPSGMAVRFRKEGKGGPFTTEIIPSPVTPNTKEAPAKKTPKKAPVKRKAAGEPAQSKKPKSAVSQAGHAYARPPLKKQQVQPPPASPGNPVIPPPPNTSTPLKAPPKVVLVSDPSKISSSSSPSSEGVLPTLKSPPPPGKGLPSSMSKEAVARLIQSAAVAQSSPRARILPKPGSQQQPIYVLAAPAGSTHSVASSLPSARVLNATSINSSSSCSAPSVSTTNSSSSIASSSISTYNAASSSSRPPRVLQVSGAPVRAASLNVPGVLGGLQPSTVRGSPRPFSTPVLPSAHIRQNLGKPSVIVVQRKTQNPAQSPLKTTTLTTKDLINKQAKIYQTPKGGAKPLVIVSKSQSLPPPASTSSLSSTSVVASSTVTTASSNQNNVIVLDLSREQLKGNSILTDLLHASGILGDEAASKEPSSINSNQIAPLITNLAHSLGAPASSRPENTISQKNT